MFPPTNSGASGQSPNGMFLDALEGMTSGTPASGQLGQQGLPVDDEPKLQPGQTDKDLYEKRKAHWQSKVDRATSHARKLEEAYEAQREAIAIGQLAMKNPALVQGLLGPQRQQVEHAEDKPPVAPERPDSFNEAEAYTNPESESWKYRKKVEQFQSDKIAFLERRDAKRDESLKRIEDERTAREELSRRNAQVAHILSSEHAFRPNELNAFFQMVQEDPTLDDLVTVFRARQRRASGGGGATQNHQPNSGGHTPPPPPVIRQGAGQPAHTVEGAFGASLIKAASGR